MVLAGLTVARSGVAKTRPDVPVHASEATADRDPPAGLTVARPAVESRPDVPVHASGAPADRDLPAGLTVARAAVAANGGKGTPGGKPWAEMPSVGTIEEGTAADLGETAIGPATPVATNSDDVATVIGSPAPTDEPATTAPGVTAEGPADETTAPTTDREVAVVPAVPTADVGPGAGEGSATASSAEPALAATPATTPAAPAVALPTTGPTAAPASTLVARLVDATTRLDSAPAPREVVLDLRDVLGGDTSISIRLVRGEVHVSVRGDLPSGEWQRDLAGSLAERGFDLGSFDQRDRTDRRSADGREPGERSPSASASDRDQRAASPGRPDHADARHAAGLRL